VTRPQSRPTILVREATPADAPAISEIALASWRATYRDLIAADAIERFLERAYTPERVALRIERHEVLVATRQAPIDDEGDDARGSGFAAVGGAEPAVEAFAECTPEDGHLQLVAIYAIPEGRGRGLGTALLDVITRRHPGETIAADVLVGNDRAEPFYTARGFEPGETLEEELGGELVTERRWWLRARR
jgi:diamine N-acetyltransferase